MNNAVNRETFDVKKAVPVALFIIAVIDLFLSDPRSPCVYYSAHAVTNMEQFLRSLYYSQAHRCCRSWKPIRLQSN